MLEARRRRRRRFRKKTVGSTRSLHSYDNISDESDFSFKDTESNSKGRQEDSLSTSSNNKSYTIKESKSKVRLSISSSLLNDEGSFDSLDSTSGKDYPPSSQSSGASRKISGRRSINSFISQSSKSHSTYQSAKRKSYGSNSDRRTIKTVNGEEGDEKVRGAVKDVYAVQDAGLYRLGFEHCSYLCSTISTVNPVSIDGPRSRSFQKSHSLSQYSQSETSVTSSKDSRTSLRRSHSSDDSIISQASSTVTQKAKDHPRKKRHHNSITANAACELANMISSSRQRSALLMASYSKHASTKKRSGGALRATPPTMDLESDVAPKVIVAGNFSAKRSIMNCSKSSSSLITI